MGVATGKAGDRIWQRFMNIAAKLPNWGDLTWIWMEVLKNKTDYTERRKVFSYTIEESSSGIIDKIESVGWKKNLT